MSETPYVETEFLLAIMNEDEARARELLDGMSQRERSALSAQLRAADRFLLTGLWSR